MTSPRRQIVDPVQPGFYHCISRCVRRAFLCGEDAESGRSFAHRKNWVEQRLLELATIFSVGAGADVWVQESEEPARLTLLCQDRAGYRNLCILLSRAYGEGRQLDRPVLQRDWLAGHTDGLVALSGIKSRFAVAAGGGLLVILGLSPMAAALFSIIPGPVLGGAGIADYESKPGELAVGAYEFGTQVWAQVKGVLLTVAWSGIGSFVIFKIVDVIIGLRVTADREREGLDLAEHGERAYNY